MDLDAIEARASAATEGPWYPVANDLVGGWCVSQQDAPPSQSRGGSVADFIRREDAEWIGHARTDVPDLVARVRELEGENKKLRVYLSHAVKFTFGTDMASHAEVTRAEQNRADGDWFFRSWGPTERHSTQEAALDAALSRAREIAGEEA
ncbi:hypothetical protein [Nocardiopsis tropica]|uniref:Uncharacterized protein n=1 Tax=Nocardiopsis tropica TaxID=109330 RepID=A0ABU7KQU1_9ACTN|nr:hypothetical protein [Nocardiopsis umidischolae]MEE2051669.1 hypothetical protein [Nocardiopsis umidischolae]